jgi:hypothetical protein
MIQNKSYFNQNKSREALILLAQIKFGVNTEVKERFRCVKYTDDDVCNYALDVLRGNSHHPSRILSKVIFQLSLYQYIIGNITAGEMKSITTRFLEVDRMYWCDREDYTKIISLI